MRFKHGTKIGYKKEIKWCMFVSFGASWESRMVKAGMGIGKRETIMRKPSEPQDRHHNAHPVNQLVCENMYCIKMEYPKWHPLPDQDKSCQSRKTC